MTITTFDPNDNSDLGCSPGLYPGRHSWTLTDVNNPDVYACRYCDLTVTDDSDGKIVPVRTWAAASAGYRFADDMNADGSLPYGDKIS